MITTIIVVFLIGYLFIVLEDVIHINKTASALTSGILCWSILFISRGGEPFHQDLEIMIAEISSILFFLMGAMTIVELMDAHDAFDLITTKIKSKSPLILLIIFSFIAFFLSAVLDNLTTSIVMVSIARKMIPEKNQRNIFSGMIIIAANAGGAWSPVGDVTTTMLWIEELISTTGVISMVFLPSLVNMVVAILILGFSLKKSEIKSDTLESQVPLLHKRIIFFTGLGSLVFVPIFKNITHLPPFMGVMLGLGVIWITSEFLNKKKDTEIREELSVSTIMKNIDIPGILFFLGILLAVGSLQVSGILKSVASVLDNIIGNESFIVMTIGLVSAVIDNVPLVAAAMGMYEFPLDHTFWNFLAYTAGTGGSCLIIGSAAGVAVMGMEKIDFIWYLKKIGPAALAGYVAGCAVYLI